MINGDRDSWEELSATARVERVLDISVDAGLCRRADFRPLTPAELMNVQRSQPAPFPVAYWHFLSRVGGGAGNLLLNNDVYYPGILNLREMAVELMRKNRCEFSFTSADRVFCAHQGYQFMFTRGDDDDPEIWYYNEAKDPTAPRAAESSFTDWLKAECESQIQWQAVQSLR